ncbi:hypothetical protein AB5N19_11830 [Seiridium cardinale]|uniref:Uncharacterized protein n=1 Tax=Seiridium cardinale TaxID=138064 RepID=A0ABR2XHH9_9PEZI
MVDQIIPLRYNDVGAVTKFLNQLFPSWSYDTQLGEYHFHLPRELDQEELQNLWRAQRHYRKRSEKRPRKH